MKKRLVLIVAAAFAICWQMNAGPVSCYGKLQVKGKDIVGSKTGTTPVQVKGVSMGWSNTGWESDAYFNANTVNAMVDLWKAEIIRAPLGVGNFGSYTSSENNRKLNKERVENVIKAAIDKDVYVIIDWHSHNAHKETNDAKEFFYEMAGKYGNNDHVIFEIYNEPVSITWAAIKEYADEIVKAIRQYSNNLILVGTPFYSQRPHDVKNNVVTDPKNNTAYVVHFYANTHPLREFRSAIETTQSRNQAVFVSEWGTCHSDGGQNANLHTHSAANSDEWHAFLDEKKISSCAWELNYKNQAASYFSKYFNPATAAHDDFINENNLRESGKYIYALLQDWATKAPWRTANCTKSVTTPKPTTSSVPYYLRQR